MKEQLKLLEELQTHDAKLQELEKAKRGIPEKLDVMRKDLAKIEELVAREKSELEETERWRRDRDAELKAQEQLLSKSKTKLSLVKNSKEYMATQREAETLRKLSLETTEKMQQVIEASGKARERVVQHTADVEKLREVVAGEERSANEKIAKIDDDGKVHRDARDAAAAAVKPEVLKRYNAIKMKRGLAVVAVKNGTCRGCNMNIPPQLFNTLQRANSIEVCPNCHRIIYWEKLFTDPATTDGAPA